MSFIAWQTQQTQRIEQWLQQQLPEHPTLPPTQAELWQAMRYALLGGGKRFRALLVFAGGELTKAAPHALDYLAGAVEALHAYSLVHDDLPCMDDDDMRRGKPTCHKVYGDAMALLAGDALHVLALEWVMHQNHHLSTATTLTLAQHFTAAIGCDGMVGGQAIDIATTLAATPNPRETGLQHLQMMHRCKTGALIAVSLKMGYLAGFTEPPRTLPRWLSEYADDLGLLFQVVDDYLDATEATATLGKTAGKDARDGKLTYVSLLGLEGTREKIDGLLANINHLLQEATLSDESRHRLMDMARWVAKRNQ